MSTTAGFSAWVSIDGVKLPQYGTETKVGPSGEEVVSSWIASEVDKKFTVHWSVPAYAESLAGWVWVDGSYAAGASHFAQIATTAAVSFKYVSPTSARPLVFSRMGLTDDDAHLGANLKDLGEIKLEIWAVVYGGRTAYRGSKSEDLPTQIHERSKKAISHRIALGEEFTIGETTFTSTTKLRHVLSFVFKYRPRDYLQAEGIMPLGPKPDTRPHKRAADVIEPSDSEGEREKELQRQEIELQNQLASIRAKRQKKKVKVEPVTNVQVKTEIIDLT